MFTNTLSFFKMKTLKDLTDPVFKRYTSGYVPSKAMKFQKDLIKEIKAEAVKWVKDLKVYCKCGRLMIGDYDGAISCPMLDENDADWENHEYQAGTESDLGKYTVFREFFNITEEDLK